MAFGIEEFKSQGIVGGGARPNAFQIQIPSIPLLTSTTGLTAGVTLQKKISLMAKAASAPPSIESEIEVGYYGRKIKVLGDRSFPNWRVTFYNDDDHMIRNVFEDWQEIMNSRQPNLMNPSTPASGTSHGPTDPNNYKRDIKAIHFSKAGDERKTYTLVGAFPVSVDPITWDWDATNQIELFDVEFAYDYWVPGDNTGGLTEDPTPSSTLLSSL